MVYGAAHDDYKHEFLLELADTCGHMVHPFILGGDFNVLRHCGEKNKNWHSSPHVDLFNSVINSFNLFDIHIEGGLYTWSNNQDHPTLEKLDRVLVSNSWECIFPLVSVRKLVRELSDHNALLVECEPCCLSSPVTREFRFEMSWLKNPEFLPLVEKIWNRKVNSSNSVDVLNIKLKRFKKFFKGWGSNKFGHSKKRKKDLREELTFLEEAEEQDVLSPELFARKVDVLAELNELTVNEELYLLQQSHERWLLQGDMNTAYYQKIANGNKRKHTIHSLCVGDEVIEGTDNLLKHAT